MDNFVAIYNRIFIQNIKLIKDPSTREDIANNKEYNSQKQHKYKLKKEYKKLLDGEDIENLKNKYQLKMIQYISLNQIKEKVKKIKKKKIKEEKIEEKIEDNKLKDKEIKEKKHYEINSLNHKIQNLERIIEKKNKESEIMAERLKLSNLEYKRAIVRLGRDYGDDDAIEEINCW